MKARRARALLLACLAFAVATSTAEARKLATQVVQLEHIPVLRPQYPVPNEPNQLFYIQRSVNANTVVYAANVDAAGKINSRTPVTVYWRWYNVDGHRKPLNFLERTMAYGVRALSIDPPGHAVAVKVVALPDRQLWIQNDAQRKPEALIQMGNRVAKLVYVYLQVDDSGFMPNVTAMDLFGIDNATGKALHEHDIQE